MWVRYEVGEICGWYCKCRVGVWVVGMCVYVVVILWFVGYVCYYKEGKLGVRDWGEFISDVLLVDDFDNLSDSEESELEEWIKFIVLFWN